ncbi:MAG: hypothetical protein KDE27_05025 [Planctomycetes bacterium]|nr:hypothetical protein [Planctomycetota bacterium]
MDTYDFLTDPRALSLAERRALAVHYAAEQRIWLRRLAALAEPPAPEPDFPAFLLATPAFRPLADRIGHAADRRALSTEVADEIDWFVVKFADYLRTQDGEDAFAPESDLRDTA